MTAVITPIKGPNLFLRDVVERAIWTFLQAAGGFWAVATPVLGVHDLHAWKLAAVGGISAGISAVKSVIFKPVGDPTSASVLPQPDVLTIGPTSTSLALPPAAGAVGPLVHVYVAQGAVAPDSAVVDPVSEIDDGEGSEMPLPPSTYGAVDEVDGP